MIPKVIHFCWLSGDPYPAKIKKCMKTWKKVMPDYEWKLWNLENFDLNSAPAYVKEAVKARKWAFAADYIRMYALYTEGGFYLDSDVKVLKRFDEFRSYNFISSIEHHPTQLEKTGSIKSITTNGTRIGEEYISGMQIQAAVMGAQPGCRFVKDVLDWYHSKTFSNALPADMFSPLIYARIAEKYGFRYIDADQDLKENIKIFRSEIFAGNKHEVTPTSYAIHYCAHSWKPSLTEKICSIFKRLKNRP
ncbi:MAG: polysaccharide biosynthesis protein [Candidatus Phocaeicola excrementipullorum]|uniref:Polysaccharide biosynthesis protein n=1 Tax=Candidatus Phocaeicola excrementipullorum TaxID=2838731 RepID=A0A948TL53_9BACT|nr:polysaccharide biosynthesis protein [Candidatus Phocaeicola excrementipullorum]